jgi:hypothetical protein
MWLDGSLYVAAPPSIWKLTDTTATASPTGARSGSTARRSPGAPTTCTVRTSAPTAGSTGPRAPSPSRPTSGRACEPLVTRAAHVFRRRPEGGPIEAVMTGGMDNPVDVVFTAAGERILTATFVEHPQRGRRDALLHAIYGGVYGKPHGVLDGHPRTGDLMPVLDHLGPAVPVGLARYESRAFGDEYRDTFFTTFFNLHTVARYRSYAGGCDLRGARLRLPRLGQPRLPSDRRPGRCRRQPAGDRHRALVQAVLPDVPARQARSPRRDLPRAAHERTRSRAIRVGCACRGRRWRCVRSGGAAGRSATCRTAAGGARVGPAGPRRGSRARPGVPDVPDRRGPS